MQIPLVVIGPLSKQLQAQLEAEYPVIRLWESDDMAKTLLPLAEKECVIVTSSKWGCDTSIFTALPRCLAICVQGVGCDKVDMPAAAALGIPTLNTPDVLSDCVADLAWGLLLGASRRLMQADRYARDGTWARKGLGSFPLTTRVSNKRLGILGLGSIGEAIARRGAGFGMEIRYTNRSPRPGAEWIFEPSLRALAEWADFLVLAVPGGRHTHHLVSGDILEALGPGGIVVNISRGSIIDQGELISRLQEGRLGGAGLDVFEDEPSLPDILTRLDNVALSPHVGGGTVETRAAMEAMVIDNIKSVLPNRSGPEDETRRDKKTVC